MNQNLTLYQVSPKVAETVFAHIEEFNRGRTAANGCYAISTSTAYRSYYAFWRIFPHEDTPLFIRTLAVTFDVSVERAFTLLQNCNVKLQVLDNRMFESYYGRTDDFISFGKYRGKRLAEIYYIDPSYVLWLANKFHPEQKRYEPLVTLAKRFAVVHFELTVQKRRISSVSRNVGQVGERLKELFLNVLNVRLQVDTYKPDFYVDQSVLAADRDGNRFVFTVKARGKSLSPNVLSCHSRQILVHEKLHLISAKVMSHYERQGVCYTVFGYISLSES